MRLSVAIQHHPKRAHLLPRLLASLEPLPVEVIPDPEPDGRASPWRTYEACLRHGLSQSPALDYLVVLQDDAEPHPAFVEALELAIAARPNRILVLWHGGQPRENLRAIQRAGYRGEAWISMSRARWLPAVAVSWPTAIVSRVLDFVAAQNWPPQFRADDEILGRATRGVGECPLATIPSWVEHPDREPSVLGRRARGGRDPGRVAACFATPDCDPTSIAWERGAE